MNRTIAALASLTLVAALSACRSEPGKDGARARVAAPAETAAAPAARDAAAYAFSGAGSKITFVAAKLTGKHDGAIESFTGTIRAAPGAPERSAVEVELDMSSLRADHDKLTGHLRSADFLDVARFPRGRFTSTSIRPGGERGATHTVTGDLELHGVTRSITFPASIRVADDRVEVDAEFSIDRKEFGIVYPGAPDDLIRDDVLIRLAIRATRKTS